jgi:cell division transport system permease protein
MKERSRGTRNTVNIIWPDMRSFFRMVKFAFQGIFRNFWLSFVTTTVFLLTLFTINAVIVLNVLADAAIKSVEDRVHIEIYFVPGTTSAQEAAVSGYLTGLPQVKEVLVIPADKALEQFKDRHARDPEILAALEEIGVNPLGDALKVTASSPEDFTFILQAVETPEFSPYIREKDAEDYQTVVEKLTNLSEKVRLGGFVMALFFALIATLIVFNTVRVAIYIHRDEIAVMRLVGARDWFIRGPFLAEVIIYSFVATVLMGGVIALSLYFWEPNIQAFFAGTDISLSKFYLDNALLMFSSQFLGLVLLSVVTSAMAMRKYLKV